METLEVRKDEQNMTYYRRIQVREVKEALNRMYNGKAVGLDDISIEVRCIRDQGISWLTNLFNEILGSKYMPDAWRSILVPIYKTKGDVKSYENYRWIKLMSQTMKLWEKVIEHRLREKTRIKENQFGFMPGWSTADVIYLLRRLMGKYRV